MIQLRDGRMATASEHGSYQISVQIWDIGTSMLLQLLEEEGVVDIYSMIQLQDDRLLTMTYVAEAYTNYFSLWNMSSNSTFFHSESYPAGKLSMNIIQVRNGEIASLDSHYMLSIYNPYDFSAPFIKFQAQNQYINNRNQLVEIIDENNKSKLLVPYDSNVIALIDTESWTIERFITFEYKGTTIYNFYIVYSGNKKVTVIQNYGPSLVVLIETGEVETTLGCNDAVGAGMVEQQVFASTTFQDNSLSLWNMENGEIMRMMTEGVPSIGTYIIPITGAITGFAVGTGVGEIVISFFSY